MGAGEVWGAPLSQWTPPRLLLWGGAHRVPLVLWAAMAVTMAVTMAVPGVMVVVGESGVVESVVVVASL